MSGVDPIAGIVGGVMIGLASTFLLATLGRLAGVSGALHELFGSIDSELRWRAFFLGGLVISGVLCASDAAATPPGAIGRLAIGGLLVGIGTRMASGCTSGHGVCGLGRRSKRSFAAVVTFVGTAMLATYVLRHVVGVAS